jgi:hypothetical protein
LDTTSPKAISILINNGANETENTLVTLSLSAYDESGEVDQITFSTDGETWTNWEDFQVIKEFILPEGDGEKSIYFKVKDKAGNIGEPISTSIKLQTYKTVDTDNDGYPDYIDAFPTDPAAAVDTDGDEYPNFWNTGMTEKDSTTGLTLDEYPNNPERHAKPKETQKTTLDLFSIMFIIILIIVLLLIFSILIRKRKLIHNIDEDEEMIESLKNEILLGRNDEESELSKNELETIYENNYQPGELSDNTKEFIENIIEDSD